MPYPTRKEPLSFIHKSTSPEVDTLLVPPPSFVFLTPSTSHSAGHEAIEIRYLRAHH